MGCGCGGSSGGSSEAAPGVLLSGSLDGQYSTLPGGTAAGTSGPSITESSITGASVADTVSNGGFWIVLFFVIGAAWYLERIKKENE